MLQSLRTWKAWPGFPVGTHSLALTFRVRSTEGDLLRYFQASKEKRGRPSCPFGKDCFYQHRNDDGTAHVMDAGVAASMRVSIVNSGPCFLSPYCIQSHFSPARTNVLSRRQVSIPFDNMAMMDELFAHASNTLVESLNEVDSWLFEERGRMRRAEEGLGLIVRARKVNQATNSFSFRKICYPL